MISIITVFVAAVFAVTIFIVNDLSDQPAQTTLGSIYLGSYEPSQYQSVVTSEVNQFLNQATYEIKYQNEIYELPISYFTFLRDQTLNTILENKNNTLIFGITEPNLIQFMSDLEAAFSNDVVELIDIQTLNTKIVSDLGQMITKKEYHLELYFEEIALDHELNIEVIEDNALVNHIDQITNEVQVIEIAPKAQFSLLDAIGDLELNNEQLSIVANGMLKVLLKSHMNGFTFETNPTPQMWSPEGFNIRILKINGYDFTFYNGHNYMYKIEIEKLSDTALTFKLLGLPYVNTYDYIIETKTTVPFRTLYVYDETIDENTIGVMITETDTQTIYHLLDTPGIDGKIIDIIRVSTNNEGVVTQTKLYDMLYLDIPSIYKENIIEKDGA